MSDSQSQDSKGDATKAGPSPHLVAAIKPGLNFSLKNTAKKKLSTSSMFKERKQEEDIVPTIIPLIKDNKWYNNDGNGDGSDQKKSLDDLATESLISKAKAQGRGQVDKNLAVADVEAIPLLVMNAIPGLAKLDSEDEKFKHDVAHRPEEPSYNAYARQPIESYGKRLLAGMGWSAGAPIGNTFKVHVDPVSFEKRGYRQGLGADAKENQFPKKRGNRRFIPKPGEGFTSNKKKKENDKKSAKDKKPRKDALVEIISGHHKSLFGRILSIKNDHADVRLNISNEAVSVSIRRIEVLDECDLPKDHPALTTSQSKKRSRQDRDSEPNGHNGHGYDDQTTDVPSSSSSSSNAKKHRPKPRIKWVVENIRIRICSKSLEGGKYYNKKGRVEDVQSPFEFLVVMDNGRTVSGVCEKHVQTVAPPAGGDVRMVKGDHKGKYGILLEKNVKRNKAVVQLSSGIELITCSLDDLAAFVM